MSEGADTPRVNGTLVRDAPIGAQSWFRCGGSADLLFTPADEDDLAAFLAQWPHFEPVTIIGGLANTIIRDGGLRGATVQLGKAMARIDVMGGNYIRSECGALNGSIAASAMKAGIGGLEFLSGIPGSIGGALRMNAGAYGSEIADIFVAATAIDREGIKHNFTAEEMAFSYRHSGVHEGLIFTSVILKGARESYEKVKSRITDIKARRNETQPIKEQTGGSTFANPNPLALRNAGLDEDMRAWQVVEKVGGRGLMIGGAKMSEKHCNFMINTGGATASDLEMLGDEIRKRALHDLGLELHWEIKRIGEM